MNKKIYLLLQASLIFIVLNSSLLNAGIFKTKDIKLTLNQSDYYFKVGENAIIPLEVENSYNRDINGILTYSYSQKIQQQGFYMTTSNSNSISFIAKKGKSVENLNFGTSNNPSVFTIKLDFKYNDGESRIVSLNSIKIHFVSDENQKQNRQNKQTASSQKYSAPKQQPQQDPFSQMQEEMNKMMGGNQNSKTTQQKIQNNQMQQDSSALKKQIQRQKEKQEELRKEFQKQLSQNPEFQKAHKKLLQEGYNLSSGELNPKTKNTGTFDLKYKKPNGESAEIRGEMKNGKINLQKFDSNYKNKIMNKLKENKNFQKLNTKLRKKGFRQKSVDFSFDENKTNIQINYKNPENKTAVISADIINGTIQNVTIDKNNAKSYFWWWVLLFLFLIVILGYYLYKKFPKKKEITKKETVKEKPFDYKKEAKKLFELSKKLFEKGEFKDAYEKAGQSLRLYLSYKNNLKKETTNDEIIAFLNEKGENTKKIKECFDLCTLVEFARYKPNKKDFEKIKEIIEKIIFS